MERDRKGIRSLEGDAVSPQSISGQVPADHERADLPSLPGPSFSPTQPIDPQQPIQIEETALPKEPPRQLPEKSVRKRSKSASRAARPNKAQTQSVQPEQREPLEQPSLFDQVPKPPPVKGRDDLFEEAVMVVQEAQRASVSLLQRKLRVGFNRATRLVEQLQQAGVLGPELGEQMGHPVLIGPNPSRSRALLAILMMVGKGVGLKSGCRVLRKRWLDHVDPATFFYCNHNDFTRDRVC